MTWISSTANTKPNHWTRSWFILKNAVFWDVVRRVDLVWIDVSEECIACSLQPPAHSGSSLADYSTLKMEAIRSSETSVHTRSTRRHIPEDRILYNYRCNNLKSYTCFSFFHLCSSQPLSLRFILILSSYFCLENFQWVSSLIFVSTFSLPRAKPISICYP
jgi:hypothetical protein